MCTNDTELGSKLTGHVLRASIRNLDTIIYVGMELTRIPMACVVCQTCNIQVSQNMENLKHVVMRTLRREWCIDY